MSMLSPSDYLRGSAPSICKCQRWEVAWQCEVSRHHVFQSDLRKPRSLSRCAGNDLQACLQIVEEAFSQWRTIDGLPRRVGAQAPVVDWRANIAVVDSRSVVEEWSRSGVGSKYVGSLRGTNDLDRQRALTSVRSGDSIALLLTRSVALIVGRVAVIGYLVHVQITGAVGVAGIVGARTGGHLYPSGNRAQRRRQRRNPVLLNGHVVVVHRPAGRRRSFPRLRAEADRTYVCQGCQR